MNLKIVAVLNQSYIVYVYNIYTDSSNRDYLRKRIRKVIIDSFPDFTYLIGLVNVYSNGYIDDHDYLFDQFYL